MRPSWLTLGGYLEASWEHLGLILGHLGGILKHVEDNDAKKT